MPKAAAKPKLFVRTDPQDARVRILNIKPKFHQGIELDAGRYHVEVSAGGHWTKTLWVSLSPGEDKTLDIRLKRGRDASPTIKPGTWIRNSIGMEFVYIRPGTFARGSSISPAEVVRRYGGEAKWYIDEHPQHQVRLTSGFYMQITEVTQSQWTAIMGRNRSHFKGDDLPVETVFWNEIQEFIRKLNQREGGNKYRLPTEAEWEYACRAGASTRFYFGNDETLLGDYAWYKGNSGERTHEVAQKKPNKWGLFDMHGNVWEWCQDWHGDYPSGSVTNPKGPSGGSVRIARGGSWYNAPWNVRSASRFKGLLDRSSTDLGFRLLRKN